MVMIVVLIVFCVVALILIGIYNNGITLKNYVKEAFSTMDVYLKKRWDLVPNLVETVKGYSEHEQEILQNITGLRSQSYSQLSNDAKMNINNEMSMALGKLIAVAENYPDLKANTTYQELMSQLANIEEDIANARKYYNGTVREFNTFIQTFPVVIFAGMFNFKEEKLYEINEAERESVKVSF